MRTQRISRGVPAGAGMGTLNPNENEEAANCTGHPGEGGNGETAGFPRATPIGGMRRRRIARGVMARARIMGSMPAFAASPDEGEQGGGKLHGAPWLYGRESQADPFQSSPDVAHWVQNPPNCFLLIGARQHFLCDLNEGWEELRGTRRLPIASGVLVEPLRATQMKGNTEAANCTGRREGSNGDTAAFHEQPE